ncbi:thiol reductant ABC exporter subunit CydC [Patulibacter sp.]|uniref:thiol reductant ABC exporter subunit CydC n=1 Tax=Patulibacter sp. TaxID=1912859 RepID=UPI0027230E9E|nr:thiol reductant ABC exporter subunit CydC [Patulibacter sp.]MDO9410867.1 thiol reductant ABC exporter subunit CydC [Patulibacter sp.]
MSTVAREGTLATVRRAVRIASPDERRRLAGAAALGAVSSLAGTALLALSGYLIARAAEQPPVLSLTVAIVCVRGLGVLRAVSRYAERLVGHDAVLGTLTRLRAGTFAALVPRIPGAVGGRSSAELLDGIVADVDRVQDVFLRSLAPLAAGLLVTVAGVVAAALVLPAAAVVVLVVAVLLGAVVPAVARRAARGTAARLAPLRARVVRDVATTLDAAPEIVMSGAADRHAERVASASDRLTALELRVATRDALVGATAVAVAGLGTVAVVAVALLARADGRIGPTSVGLLALLALGLGEALTGLPQAARELHDSTDAVRRVERLAAAPATGGAARPEDGTGRPDGGVVRLRDVAVRRGGRTVLRGTSMTVGAGERVALVGPSGVGKSTIVDLLVGFVDPGEWTGEASVGGCDLRTADGRALRRTVLGLPQDPYVFDASLRANLVLARPDAGDDELVAALRAVGAGAWLAGLEDGLDTPLGDRGARCSGGERQRIGLARGVLARGHALVLLDEPASHLPPAEAVEALRAVLDAVPGRAALIVAHRPEEAALAPRAVTLAAD